MGKILNLILCAAIDGLFATAAFGTLFFFLEEKKPLLKGLKDGGNGVYDDCLLRMYFCVWIVTSLFYILLTDW